jgi:hypothetical protein
VWQCLVNPSQVNHSPSFAIDTPVDRAIKEQLLLDTMALLRIDGKAVAATRKAARKATRSRLLAPTLSQTSRTATGSSSCSCSSTDNRHSRQEQEAAACAHRWGQRGVYVHLLSSCGRT